MKMEKVLQTALHDEETATLLFGDDRNAAYAKALEIERGYTFDEFEKFISQKKADITDGVSIGIIIDKINNDAAFASHVDTTNSPEELYALCKDFLSMTVERFKQSYEQVLNGINIYIEKTAVNRELTDDELDIVGGGSSKWRNFWKKVGNWFKKNGAAVASFVGGAITAIASAATLNPAGVAAGMLTVIGSAGTLIGNAADKVGY